MRKITVGLSISLLAFFLHFALTQHGQQKSSLPGPQFSGARYALEQINLARTYPYSQLPASGFAQAFEYVKVLKARKVFRPQVRPWRSIGPSNIGGRTLAIAINPENPGTIYAGSASGGLWRSYTGGTGENAWERIATGFPVLGVAAIAISPIDTNVIYIGTGEVYGHSTSFPGVSDRRTRGSYGIGILKSMDGGRTWQKSLDWSYNQRTGVQKIRLNPQNPNTVWAATSEGTYLSYDAGETWERVLEVVMATDIAINPSDTNIVFVACGGMASPGHGIYRSKNGGKSWEKLTFAPSGPSIFSGKAMLSISESSPNIIYVSIGNSNGELIKKNYKTWLMKSTDDGDTWEVVSTVDYSRYQGWYSHYVRVHPKNPDIIFCGGVNLWKSTDGGETLRRIDHDPKNPKIHVDNHEMAFVGKNPDIIYFVNDGGIHKTEDGGRTFENCNRGYQTTQFYNGFTSSEKDSNFAIGGLQDNNTALFVGRQDWNRVIGGDGSWTAMNQVDNEEFYGSLQWLRMFRWDSFKKEWLDITPPRKGLINFIAPFVLSPVDNRTLFAGTSFVFKSMSRGDHWTVVNRNRELDGNPLIVLAASAMNANVVYAATSPYQTRGNIFATRDGGNTWEKITENLPDRFPTDLVVAPRSDQIVYVTLGGFGSSHLFKTEDGGQRWKDIGQGLPDVPAWSIAIDPFIPEHLYLGNDLGVFLSLDGGRSWQPLMDGLPEAIIAMELSVSPSNRAIRVATHGNGVYERPLSPQLADDNLPNKPPTEIILAQNYPNPFSARTTIRYYLQEEALVEIMIYNRMGQFVRRLFYGRQSAGWKEADWNGRDENGFSVASGVYVYQLRAGRKVLVGKIALTR